MNRIAYITDTHIGGAGEGWCQQPCCPQRVPELMTDLHDWLALQDVDLVVIGGDVTDTGSTEQQRQVMRIAERFAMPVLAVLGNHDLSAENALGHWRTDCRELLGSDPTPTADAAVHLPDVTILAMTNAWRSAEGRAGFVWTHGDEQWAALTERQYQWMADQLAERPETPAILVMHETLYPLPKGLTGLDEPIHAPGGGDIDRMVQFIERHAQIRLVLSGHCHATCRTFTGPTGCAYVTTSAFCEPPFQVRIVTVADNRIDVETAMPVDVAALGVAVDESKLWTAGRWIDQRITIDL